MLCPRAREWASLKLDAELSEFETALLGAHLARCEQCRVFVQQAEAITEHVRETPLEPLERRIVLPSGRRGALRALPVAATLAAAAGVVLGLSLQSHPELAPNLHPGPPAVEVQQLRTMHVAQFRPAALMVSVKPRNIGAAAAAAASPSSGVRAG